MKQLRNVILLAVISWGATRGTQASACPAQYLPEAEGCTDVMASRDHTTDPDDYIEGESWKQETYQKGSLYEIVLKGCASSRACCPPEPITLVAVPGLNITSGKRIRTQGKVGLEPGENGRFAKLTFNLTMSPVEENLNPWPITAAEESNTACGKKLERWILEYSTGEYETRIIGGQPVTKSEKVGTGAAFVSGTVGMGQCFNPCTQEPVGDADCEPLLPLPPQP